MGTLAIRNALERCCALTGLAWNLVKGLHQGSRLAILA